ncbi:MAG: helix-turn-helix domain-containing protein [Terrimesophilobacter sp.]
MAVDAMSVARVLDGVIVGESLPPTTMIDSVSALNSLNVLAHPGYACLVVAAPEELLDASGDEGSSGVEASPLWNSSLAILQSTILVVSGDSREIRNLLTNNGVTGILCPSVAPPVLLPKLISMLASDQAAEDRLVTQGMKVLTQVARRGGVPAVMAELAHRIDGWAVLLDSQGHAITSSGAGTLHIQDATAVALNRPVKVRHPGLQVHPVGQGEDLTAYLVIASRAGSMSRIRDLASQAAALLDLLLRSNDHFATERLGREVMMQRLLAGDAVGAEFLLRRWGVLEDTMTAFVLSSRSKSVDLERLLTRWFDDLGCVHVMTMQGDRMAALIRDDRAEMIADLVANYASHEQHPLRCGFGTSVGFDALSRSMAEAYEAHATAVTDGRSIAFYAALPTVQYVLEHLGPESSAQLASVLDGLRDEHGAHGELTHTLQVYLAEHGSWGVAASRLGVHRQTLSLRMKRAERLTGLSMSNPDDRAAAWLAIRALKRELH